MTEFFIFLSFKKSDNFSNCSKLSFKINISFHISPLNCFDLLKARSLPNCFIFFFFLKTSKINYLLKTFLIFIFLNFLIVIFLTLFLLYLCMTEIIKGSCDATKQLRKLVEMVSVSGSTVLLRGETGCGKDVVARAIHDQSKRKGDLINVNCAAIPSELLESELFGHEKGAFTGADSKREGRFEASNNGALFLDEIGIYLFLFKQNY